MTEVQLESSWSETTIGGFYPDQRLAPGFWTSPITPPRAKLANIIVSIDEVHVPILSCDLQQFHQGGLKGRYLVSVLAAAQPADPDWFMCTRVPSSPPPLLSIPGYGQGPSERQSFSHDSVAVAELQEAAAGGRSQQAAGLVGGVASASCSCPRGVGTSEDL